MLRGQRPSASCAPKPLGAASPAIWPPRHCTPTFPAPCLNSTCKIRFCCFSAAHICVTCRRAFMSHSKGIHGDTSFLRKVGCRRLCPCCWVLWRFLRASSHGLFFLEGPLRTVRPRYKLRVFVIDRARAHVRVGMCE